jgi:3-hydroxyacyl-[acyl-carrier-protein] dehydratase
MRLEYFELVDRIVQLSVPEGVVHATAHVPMQSPIFEGHFPDHPIMPGVLLIEAMAQTSGWIILALSKFERMPFLAGVKDAKLRNFVNPGTDLLLTAKVMHEGSGYVKTQTEVMVDNVQTCSAQLTFRVLPFPSPIFRNMVQAAARRVDFPMELAAHDQ